MQGARVAAMRPSVRLPDGVKILGAALLLGGCTTPITTETSVSHAALHSGAASETRYYLPDPPSEALRGSAHDEMALATHLTQQALEARRWVAADGAADGGNAATHWLSLSLASRPSELELRDDRGVIAQASHQGPGQNCNWQQYRLVLALTDRHSGTVDHRVSVAEHHCKASVTQALPALVERAVAGLELPTGSYQTRRKGIR